MKKWGSILLGILFTILFIEVLVGFPIGTEKPEPPAQALGESAEAQAEKRFGGVHFVEAKEGTRDWELFSDTAESFEATSEWKLKQVRALFFKENKLQFTVTGEKGRIHTQTKDLQIVGDVVTKSSNGYVFRSQSIHYDSKQRRLFTLDKIDMQSPPDGEGLFMSLKGIGMESFIESHIIIIQDKVDARRALAKNRTVFISSQKAEFSSGGHSARFMGKVLVNYEETRLEGPEFELKYLPSSYQIDSLEARGGVRLTDNDKFATADEISIFPATNEIRLVGRPRVVQDQDEILGDQIFLLDGGKKIQVEKIRAHVEKLGNEK